MDQPEKVHIELWTKGVFPLALFEKLLQKDLESAGYRLHFKEDKSLNWLQQELSDSQLSITLKPLFYKDYIVNGKGNALHALLISSLKPLASFESNLEEDKKRVWLDFNKNKYEFTYESNDVTMLHFPFNNEWNEMQQNVAFDAMIRYIGLYEAKNRDIHADLEKVPTGKDQIWFLLYDQNKVCWSIQDHLADITHRISKDYYQSKNDPRVAKPEILMNEDKFNDYFVWDQQWRLTLERFEVIMAKPNDIALYISLMEKNLTRSISFMEDALSVRKASLFYNMMPGDDTTTRFYDYFEHVIAAITFSYTAIETLANICILENYEYAKKDGGVTTIYNKEGIERYFKLREKFKIIIRDILQTPDPTKEPWWSLFIQLEDIRNEIIHTKQSKSHERYSKFLSIKIFPIVEVSKTIVAYYGNFINSNRQDILIDFPFGFGYDNTRPSFMTNEDYRKHRRDSHGIPD